MTRWNIKRDRTLDFKEVADSLERKIAGYKPKPHYFWPKGPIAITLRNRQHVSNKNRHVKITLPSMPWEQNK